MRVTQKTGPFREAETRQSLEKQDQSGRSRGSAGEDSVDNGSNSDASLRCTDTSLRAAAAARCGGDAPAAGRTVRRDASVHKGLILTSSKEEKDILSSYDLMIFA